MRSLNKKDINKGNDWIHNHTNKKDFFYPGGPQYLVNDIQIINKEYQGIKIEVYRIINSLLTHLPPNNFKDECDE